MAGLLLVAACSGGGGDAEAGALRPVTTLVAPAPTLPPTSAATVLTTTPAATTAPPRTPPVDEWAIPPLEEIDVAYVQRVVSEIDRIDGDIFRDAVARGEMDDELRARLATIYGGLPLLAHQGDLSELQSSLNGAVPGNRAISLRNLVEATGAPTSCILANATIDATSFMPLGGGVLDVEVVFRSLRPEANVTGWQITAMAPQVSPEERCVSPS